MEQLINIIDNNYKYAPGLPTYGLPGMTGKPGTDGNNIYYTNVILSETTATGEVYKSENLSIIIDLMDNGKYPRTDTVQILNRKIIDGDLFLTPDGKLYKFNADNSDITFLIRLKNWSQQSQFIDNSVLEWKVPSNWDISNITDTSAERLSQEFTLLNIKNESNVKVNENQFIKLTAINQGNVDSLKTYFDNEINAFHMNADTPIVVGSDVYVKYTDDKVIKRSENYSQVLTENNPVTNFITVCKSLNWNISDFNDDQIFQYLQINTYDYKRRLSDSNFISFELSNIDVNNESFFTALLTTNDENVEQLEQGYHYFGVTQKGVIPKIIMHIPVNLTQSSDTLNEDNELTYKDIYNDFLQNGINSVYWPTTPNTFENKKLYWVTFEINVIKQLLNFPSGIDPDTQGAIEGTEAITNIENLTFTLSPDNFNNTIMYDRNTGTNLTFVKIPYIDCAVFEFEQCDIVTNKSYVIVHVQDNDNSSQASKYIHKINVFMDFDNEYDFEYKRHLLKDKLIKIVLHDGSQLYVKADSYIQFDFNVYKNNKNTIDCSVEETTHNIKYVQSKNTK